MNKNYNTTYTTVKACQIQNITYEPNYANTILQNGVINTTTSFGAIGGVRYNIPTLTSAGIISIPNLNSKAIVNNIGIGQSQYAITGYMYNTVDTRNKILQKGETCIFSNEYFINILNNALKIEYSKINPQECQLPIGEATQQAFTIILNEIINNLKPYINAQIVATFNTHTHTSATPGTPTSAPNTTITANYTENTNTDNALTYMQASKLLISENGVNTI